jgi:heat-inducible transcriptional repressor
MATSNDATSPLGDRKSAILKAVVEEHIETAQPVGSGHIAAAAGVDISAATIRNEMSVLEREGYLAQPHTSAGRIPTDKGYRYFVDEVVSPASKSGFQPLDPAQSLQVRDVFDTAYRRIEQLLSETSKLLAGLTSTAAVVVAPQPEAATVKHVQIVELASHRMMVVAVLSNGVVQQEAFESDATGAVAQATQVLERLVVGDTLARALPDTVSFDGVSPEVTTLAQQAANALRNAMQTQTPLYVGGVPQLAGSFDAINTVQEIYETLEQQFVVVSMLRDVLDKGSVEGRYAVGIGGELGVVPLAECSVIVAPYEVEGKPAGSIGVLGPTRMNYPQALAAVAKVSQELSRRLTEG